MCKLLSIPVQIDLIGITPTAVFLRATMQHLLADAPKCLNCKGLAALTISQEAHLLGQEEIAHSNVGAPEAG